MTMTEELSVRIPEAGREILEQALNDSRGMILDVCNRTSLPPRMENLQLSLGEIYARRILAAGEESRSEGGVSVHYAYIKDIPEDMMKRIMSYRKLKQAAVAHEAKISK